jgi:hypothetical protein
MSRPRETEDPAGATQPERAAHYDVGYRKPPKASRFKKGRSGNPAGRPKGSATAKSLLDKALSAPVTISEGGVNRTVEQRMALFKSLVARAIKGDTRAAALVVRLMDQFDLGKAPDHQPVTLIKRIIVDPRGVERPVSTSNVPETNR